MLILEIKFCPNKWATHCQSFLKKYTMATYECKSCGMAVNASCAKCDQPLENDMLTLPDGNQVQISICRSCEGKIKSPQCCGADMSCTM